MQETKGLEYYGKRIAVGVAIAVFTALINYLVLNATVVYAFIAGLVTAFFALIGLSLFDDWLDRRIDRRIKTRETGLPLPVGTKSHETLYATYSELVGLAYEALVVDFIIGGTDGSVVVRRRSRIVSHSAAGIDNIDHYLIAEASDGDIGEIEVESSDPFRRLSWNAVHQTPSALTLSITIDPPLAKGDMLEFRVAEVTPSGSITRTKQEMYDKIAAGEKTYPYESLWWDIVRPTKHLTMRVSIPEDFQPESCKVMVWYGASRLPHELESKRIEDGFHEELLADHYVVSLNAEYPLPGMRYAINLIPRDAQ